MSCKRCTRTSVTVSVSFPSLASLRIGLSRRPDDSQGNSWRVLPKVSGRKFPFPRLLFATCPPRPISNSPWGFEPRHLSGFECEGSAGRREANEQGWIVRCACAGCLESERAPLIRPCHRQVDETLEAKAARQASLDRRLDDL